MPAIQEIEEATRQFGDGLVTAEEYVSKLALILANNRKDDTLADFLLSALES